MIGTKTFGSAARIGIVLCAVSAGLHPLAAAEEVGAIAGRWITFAGALHQKRAVIQIVRTGAIVTGRIVDFFPKPGEDSHPICLTCQGADQGLPILGLKILEMVEEAGGHSFRGTVFDPEEGRTYRCVATLQADGKQLHLRGYIGIELFGRSETWVRLE
ncbi:MAG: DUF2147 domain-containing protein [Pseudomonadota bacterium]